MMKIKHKVDWPLTIIVMTIFIGSVGGTFLYNLFIGDKLVDRVEELESKMKIVMQASMLSMENIIETERERNIPKFDDGFKFPPPLPLPIDPIFDNNIQVPIKIPADPIFEPDDLIPYSYSFKPDTLTPMIQLYDPNKIIINIE